MRVYLEVDRFLCEDIDAPPGETLLAAFDFLRDIVDLRLVHQITNGVVEETHRLSRWVMTHELGSVKLFVDADDLSLESTDILLTVHGVANVPEGVRHYYRGVHFDDLDEFVFALIELAEGNNE